MNPWLTAFVDETGTNDLTSDSPGTSHLFICVAVLVDEKGLTSTEAAVRELSQDLCSGAEISSRRIGSDHKRRAKFLEPLRSLPFTYYALVINKDRIPKDSGLRFKQSFYKYINRMLYQRLAKGGKSLRIIADELGGADFMASFRSYLESHRLPDLFNQCEHSFADSSTTPLIQLADLIAGTLAYCFDPAKTGPHSQQFRELLRPREMDIRCWPWEPLPQSETPDAAPTPDARLQYALRRRVVTFLTQYENSTDPDRSMQAATLISLLFARQFEDREMQAIVSDVLMARLRGEGFEEMHKQAFQSRVIGKIRDEGIILAGASDGYRLALTVADIQEYLDHDKSIIEPMLARMLKARETVMSDTTGACDILLAPANHRLKKIAETFHDTQIEAAVPRDQSAQVPT